MLVKKVSFNDFLEEFKKYGREDQFSYEGKKALYDYLNKSTELIELNIICICRDFTEYACLEEFNDAYGYIIGYDVNSINDIHYYTTVIQIDNESFIIRDF